MKFFTRLYDKALSWAEHPKAIWFLGLLGFSESIFFPVPTDVMLAPMSLAKPQRAWELAFIATITSVLGGLAGFVLGYFLFDSLIHPNLESWGYLQLYLRVVDWFANYGIWVVFIAGFSPVPYKVFTLAAGALHMAFIPFALISLISRGARFYLVAGLMRWGGEAMKEKLRSYVDAIGWFIVFLVVVYGLYLFFN